MRVSTKYLQGCKFGNNNRAVQFPESLLIGQMFDSIWGGIGNTFSMGSIPRVSSSCRCSPPRASDPTSVGNALDGLLLPTRNQPNEQRKLIEETIGNLHHPPSLRTNGVVICHSTTPGIHHRWQRNGPLNCRSHRKRWTSGAVWFSPRGRYRCPLGKRYLVPFFAFQEAQPCSFAAHGWPVSNWKHGWTAWGPRFFCKVTPLETKVSEGYSHSPYNRA